MKLKWSVVLGAVIAALFVVSALAAPITVTDRGLPDDNLNNVAGSSRSNVAWSFGNDWMTGDDFTIGVAGETWVVTSLASWQVAGAPGGIEFGDRYSDASLYIGAANPGGVSLVTTGTLNVGSSVNNNANITHVKVAYDNNLQPNYQGTSGSQIQVWKTTFSGLAVPVAGGVKYNFAVDGTVRVGSNYWFNHASNAALSGTTQQGSDNLYKAWAKNDLSSAPFECDSGNPQTCGGWDKSSDINVMVVAVRVATDEASCKNGGWQSLARLDGSSFKNQGDCVSYAQNGR